jgi:hypothetical protein
MKADFYDFPEGCTPRKGRLMASGIILGLLGCAFGLLAAFYLVFFPMLIRSFPTPAPPPPMAPASGGPAAVSTTFSVNPMGDLEGMTGATNLAGGMMALIALWFLIAGIGSIFLKRWSRPMALYLGVVWLYMGIFYLVFTLATLGTTKRMMAEQMASAGATGPPPDAFFGIFAVVSIVFLFVCGILLPGLILWLNWHRDVKTTLEFCDPKPRWTDRCPAPVLGISFGSVTMALGMTGVMFFPVLPLFGKTLEGAPAQIVVGAIFLALILAAWGVYRRQLFAWGACVVIITLLVVSALMSDPKAHYLQIYERMGMSEEMIEQSMKSIDAFANPAVFWVGALGFFLPVLGYLIWALRFFLPGRSEDESSVTESV